MSIKCNLNYQSLYAFVDNTQIHIDDLIKSTDEKVKQKIKCINGHQLIFANGKKNKRHFRHKNTEDMDTQPITEWHSEWQGNFPTTEIDFKKNNNKQIKDRRADVVLTNSNYNIEFQHSHIEKIEIQNRKNDYELHNRKILWVIHGNKTINVKYLEYSNRYYLEFITEKWKYESFIDYEYIFIDIDEQIYKIFPKDVKNGMIDVEPPISKNQFIIYLNENNLLIHNIDKPIQCNLYIKQQGAGNGKTFGLIQNIENKDFEHYKCFIIVTKQHSAKTVIYTELQKQIENNDLKYIKNLKCEDNNKKYQISYTNENTGYNCHILIATIDSVMWSLGNNKNNELNKFVGIVNSIIKGYISENNISSIKSNGKNYKLNKELCLFIDESQDLSENYGEAIIEIMRNNYIDSYIVGDKLQSIDIINNAFNYLQDTELSYINKKLYEATNICRRFYYTDLFNFVNTIVPFSKYRLPEITPYRPDDEINTEHIKIFEGNNIRADADKNEEEKNKINKEVEIIMKHYENEVNNNNYKPNDFLIITPFTTKNPLVNALEIAIEIYWTKKYNNDTYERYAIFHKSEEGNSINLTESENSTRIVSIKTSKGDGRNVVFIIGLDERSLLKFSNEKDNLIYDSLIHVSITRMKKKLYIRLVNNGDDISQKIGKYLLTSNISTDIIPILEIKNIIKYKEIIDYLKINKYFDELQNNIINQSSYNSISFENNHDKRIIDMSNHNIRYASMLIYLFIKIINNETKINDNIKCFNVKKQINVIFRNIKKADLYKLYKWQDYYKCLIDNNLCVLKITKNGKDYIKYFDIICAIIDNIKSKVDNILNNKINELCPLESIILYYLIEIIDKGIYTEITMNELYNIIDVYSKSYSINCQGHDKCICNKCFDNITTIEKNSNIEKMGNYLFNHYENINNLGKIYDDFLSKYSKINWLINHKIYYNGCNNEYIIYKDFQLLGYDNNDIYIIYIKPQFNDLNYNDTLVESIYDSYILKSIKLPNNDIKNDEYNKLYEDYKKFNNKNIYTIVFSLDNKKYHLFQWNNSDNIDLININKDLIIKQLKDKLINKFVVESKYIINYYKYWKNKFININPDKIIKNIIIEYKKNNNYDKMPPFILKFFEKIQYELLYNKHKKLEILIDYDNNEFFISKLEEVIIESIEDFLGIENL
jgi:hypothetical protein